MWACQYGLGLFEARESESLNYNLLLEVGAMVTRIFRLDAPPSVTTATLAMRGTLAPTSLRNRKSISLPAG